MNQDHYKTVKAHFNATDAEVLKALRIAARLLKSEAARGECIDVWMEIFEATDKELAARDHHSTDG